MKQRPLVAVIDDDISVRESVPGLLQHAGLAAQAFASAEEFLAADVTGATDCLVLDVGLPGISGAELQKELARRGTRIPIVFITANEDKALHLRLLADGAVACLSKPFSDRALIEAVEAALGTKRETSAFGKDPARNGK
jgi:FixJ family two-component response regulator